MTIKYSFIGGYLNSILGFPIDDALIIDTSDTSAISDKIKKIISIKSELDIIRLNKIEILEIIKNIKINIENIKIIGHLNITEEYISNILQISKYLINLNKIFDKININKKINIILYTEESGKIIIDKSKINNILNMLIKNINEIEELLKNINLECFYNNKTIDDNLQKCDEYKSSFKNIKKDLLYKYPLFNFTKIFNEYKINNYIILDEDNYEIYKNNYKIDNIDDIDDNYYFKLTTELSLKLIPKPIDIKLNSNFLSNTSNKKFDDFISAKIINNNNALKEILIKKINEDIIDKSLNKLFIFIQKLYGYSESSKQFMIDIYNKYNNIFLILLFINKVTILYDFLNKHIDINECKQRYSDIINSNLEFYSNVFNYYKTVNNLRLNLNENILKDINVNLKISMYRIKDEFIQKINEFIDEINSIENELPSIIKYLLTDYILDITSQNDFNIYPFSKRKLFETLFEKNAYPNDIIDIDNKNIDSTDKYFNKESYLPYLYSKKEVNYKGIIFADCGEATLFNFITYLITDKKNNNFLLEKLPENSNIHIFFNKFKNYNELKKQFKTNTLHIKNEWATILYEHKGIEYQHNEICEIIPSYKNVLNLINILFQKKDDRFVSFEQFIKYFNDSNIIEGEQINNTNDINMKINDEIQLNLSNEHGSYEIYNKINVETSKFKIIEIEDESDESDEVDSKLLYLLCLDKKNYKLINLNLDNIQIIDYIISSLDKSSKKLTDDELTDDELTDDELRDDELRDDELTYDELTDDDLTDDELTDDDLTDDRLLNIKLNKNLLRYILKNFKYTNNNIRYILESNNKFINKFINKQIKIKENFIKFLDFIMQINLNDTIDISLIKKILLIIKNIDNNNNNNNNIILFIEKYKDNTDKLAELLIILNSNYGDYIVDIIMDEIIKSKKNDLLIELCIKIHIKDILLIKKILSILTDIDDENNNNNNIILFIEKYKDNKQDLVELIGLLNDRHLYFNIDNIMNELIKLKKFELILELSIKMHNITYFDSLPLNYFNTLNDKDKIDLLIFLSKNLFLDQNHINNDIKIYNAMPNYIKEQYIDNNIEKIIKIILDEKTIFYLETMPKKVILKLTEDYKIKLIEVYNKYLLNNKSEFINVISIINILPEDLQQNIIETNKENIKNIVSEHNFFDYIDKLPKLVNKYIYTHYEDEFINKIILVHFNIKIFNELPTIFNKKYNEMNTLKINIDRFMTNILNDIIFDNKINNLKTLNIDFYESYKNEIILIFTKYLKNKQLNFDIYILINSLPLFIQIDLLKIYNNIEAIYYNQKFDLIPVVIQLKYILNTIDINIVDKKIREYFREKINKFYNNINDDYIELGYTKNKILDILYDKNISYKESNIDYLEYIIDNNENSREYLIQKIKTDLTKKSYISYNILIYICKKYEKYMENIVNFCIKKLNEEYDIYILSVLIYLYKLDELHKLDKSKLKEIKEKNMIFKDFITNEFDYDYQSYLDEFFESQNGGNINYYSKYLKYKQKYLKLKTINIEEIIY